MNQTPRYQPTNKEIADAVTLVKFAEHNAEFADDPLVKAALDRDNDQRCALDYLLLSTNEWKDGNHERSLRLAYTGLAVGTDNGRIAACLELRLGTVFHDLGSEDRSWELAEQCYNAARETDPSFALSQIFAGDLLFDQDEFDEAELCYEKAKSLDANDPSTYNSLGYLYLEQGELKKAEQAFKAALALKPDIPIIHLHLATLYQEQGRVDEAVSEFEKAIARYPENATWYTHLGVLLIELGRFEEAAQTLEKAKSLRPDDEAVEEALALLKKSRQMNKGSKN